MNTKLETIGLETVDRFITTWNTRDPERWAGSLNYPHVRPSPFGPINVSQSLEEYAAAVDFQTVVDSGWDHSEWDYKKVLHISSSKIHVAGQWSRYSAEGEVILTTPITYICTLVEGKWGIQCRFGADYVSEETDTTEVMSRGLNLVQDFVNLARLGNRNACAELLNYPHFEIGNGELDITNNATEFQSLTQNISIDGLQAIQTGRHSMNVAADLSIAGEVRQAVINLNDRDGHLGIMAWSLLIPEEVEAS